MKTNKKQCPQCKEEITELNFDVTGTCSSSITKEELEANTLQGFSPITYEINCLTDNVEYDNFSCPSCSEPICDTEEEAKEFLK